MTYLTIYIYLHKVFAVTAVRNWRRCAGTYNTPQPTNAHEIRSLLGMANYCTKYIRDFETLTAPLRELTRKHVRFGRNEKRQTVSELKNQGAYVLGGATKDCVLIDV